MMLLVGAFLLLAGVMSEHPTVGIILGLAGLYSLGVGLAQFWE